MQLFTFRMIRNIVPDPDTDPDLDRKNKKHSIEYSIQHSMPRKFGGKCGTDEILWKRSVLTLGSSVPSV